MSSSKILNLLILGVIVATALAVIAHLPENSTLTGTASVTGTPGSSGATREEWPTFDPNNLQQYVVEPTSKGVPRTPVDYSQQPAVDFILPVDQQK